MRNKNVYGIYLFYYDIIATVNKHVQILTKL